MISFSTRLKQNTLTLVGVFCFFISVAQLPTYTIDESFNTDALFRSHNGASDFHFLDDGRILIGGGVYNVTVSEAIQTAYGMINDNGSWAGEWSVQNESSVGEIIPQSDGYVFTTGYSAFKVLSDGTPWSYEYGEFWSDYFVGGTNNPYNVQRLWDIHQQEDGNLLIGGAIATDTLQPALMRGVCRLLEDGSHDSDFPAIDITPSNGGGMVRRIFPSPDGSWYISGGFTAINGHETNHVAKLTPEFEVDIEFVSPFVYAGPGVNNEDIVLVDSQNRVWVSGFKMRLQENPTDTIQLIRLFPDGTVDESFTSRLCKNVYPEEYQFKYSSVSKVIELESNPGNFLMVGVFSHFDEMPQACIAVVNDSGEIQEHFFQGLGATVNDYSPIQSVEMPSIQTVREFDNGDLLIGGAFSEFMGETHYSVVRLKLGVLGTENQSALNQMFKLWPNPVSHSVNVSFEGLVSGEVKIMNLTGQVVETHQMLGETLKLNTTELPKGIYFVSLETMLGVAVKKMVVQ